MASGLIKVRINIFSQIGFYLGEKVSLKHALHSRQHIASHTPNGIIRSFSTSNNSIFRKFNMSDLQTMFSEAVTLHQQGELTKAKKLYLQVHQAVPENLNVLANLAIICRDLGEHNQAEEYCRKTLEQAPDNPDLHLNLGAVLEAKGDLGGASDCYRASLDLSPLHPKAHNNLGKVLHQLGQIEEGRKHLEKAVEIEPAYPLALNNLGVILSEQGDLVGGKRCLEQSVRFDPANVSALYNLAGVYNGLNEPAKAQRVLSDLLDLEPNHQAAGHMMSALSGETTSTAPRQYVEETFDKYACRFDTHIQNKLGYDVPNGLAKLLKSCFDVNTSFKATLDLGCGTGLSGQPFKDFSEKITGVDVSANMLEVAKQKGIYDELVQEDIVDFLKSSSGIFDLCILADVLIYLGDPGLVFPLLQVRLEKGALIACSIERNTETESYRILHSGRYGHNPSYLLACAERYGFSSLAHQEHRIRKENDLWLDGDIYILKKV